jgi:hypothetical protein
MGERLAAGEHIDDAGITKQQVSWFIASGNGNKSWVGSCNHVGRLSGYRYTISATHQQAFWNQVH